MVAELLRLQAGWCDRLGSPLYARLLEHAATDVAAGGPVRELLRGHESDSPGSALALRLMGSMHRLVLEGQVPELAPYYPSVGGRADAEAAWPVFRTAVERHARALGMLLERPVQTNEVGRSSALLGGFLLVARTGLPLRLLEVGASAGLNLRWDLYRYECRGTAWGDPDSPVRLVETFEARPTFPSGSRRAAAATGIRSIPRRPKESARSCPTCGRTSSSVSPCCAARSPWRDACRS